jgi:creatinine amidohydrolase
MILHIARELVREGQLEAARDGGLLDIEAADHLTQNGARTFYDAVENSENGVFGDQTDATPEVGERLFEAATEQLVELTEWLDDRRFEDLMTPAHVDPQPGSRR